MQDIPGKALSCETPEFGTISQKEITQTLEHIFGAKTKKSHGTRKLIFDISKLKRLGNVYDLAVQVKVVEGDSEDNSRGADMTDWTDVGLGRYVVASTNESEKKEIIPISERGDTLTNGPAHPLHPPQAANQTPSDTSDSTYEHLIETEQLPSLNRTVYRCKEHPEVPYYNLEGIEESNFKPVHS